MEKVKIVIIGAGIVGLSIAEKLSKKYDNIILVEKEESFGRHTSSRNSEVIHSGLYYPNNSLKAKLCVKGNELLYNFLEKYDIPYNNCGKLIVATKSEEKSLLKELYGNGVRNNVKGMKIISKKEAHAMEPEINSEGALFVPSTGIMDTHSFMKKMEFLAEENNTIISYATEVTDIEKDSDGYILSFKEDDFKIKSEILINSAGLWSDDIAEMLGLDIEKNDYQLYYCKGEYYKTTRYKDIEHLVYPVPTNISLGIHIRINLNGEVSFGPSAYYVDELDYRMDEKYKEDFYDSINAYMDISMDDLHLDDCGIRPKLQDEDEQVKDFVIKNENDLGFPNFINLVGIDSPGLTSSLSIAEYVEELIE